MVFSWNCGWILGSGHLFWIFAAYFFTVENQVFGQVLLVLLGHNCGFCSSWGEDPNSSICSGAKIKEIKPNWKKRNTYSFATSILLVLWYPNTKRMRGFLLLLLILTAYIQSLCVSTWIWHVSLYIIYQVGWSFEFNFKLYLLHFFLNHRKCQMFFCLMYDVRCVSYWPINNVFILF